MDDPLIKTTKILATGIIFKVHLQPSEMRAKAFEKSLKLKLVVYVTKNYDLCNQIWFLIPKGEVLHNIFYLLLFCHKFFSVQLELDVASPFLCHCVKSFSGLFIFY
jgi:hypothetical protein